MIPSFRWIVAAFLILFLILLIARAPATLLSGQLQQQFPELSLHGVEGSVWSGSAKAVDYDGIVVGRMHWTFNPSDLLFASWGNRFELINEGRLAIDGDVSLSAFGDSALSDVEIRSTLAWLISQSGYPTMGLTIDADLDALVADASWSDSGTFASLSVDARLKELEVQSALLGDFSITIGISENAETRVDFQPIGDNGLDARGTVTIDAVGFATLDMTLARLDVLGKHAPLVKSLTRKQGDRQQFTWKGDVSAFLR